MTYTTETTALETIHILKHDGFVLRWSDLDCYCWIYKGKVLVKDLIHQYRIPKVIASKQHLQQTLHNEISLYKKCNK